MTDISVEAFVGEADLAEGERGLACGREAVGVSPDAVKLVVLAMTATTVTTKA